MNAKNEEIKKDSLIIEKVKSQYEHFPYPDVNWLARPHKLSGLHASFETGAALTLKKDLSATGRRIALLGCGTNEALVFAQSHPQAQEIVAVDASTATIRKSKLRCTVWGSKLPKIRHINSDIISFAQSLRDEDKFDYIHCYGVLHHLPDLQNGCLAIKNILKPEGFARVMVYSEVSRRRIRMVQYFLKSLGIHFESTKSPTEAKRLVRLLPVNHPLRITFERHPEVKAKSGLVDAFLHAHENAPTLSELNAAIDGANLSIRAWDFSKNGLDLLNLPHVKKFTHNQIEGLKFLEAVEQWPAPYIFWLTHKNLPQDISKSHTAIALHPFLKKKKFIGKSLYSACLKKNVAFTNSEKILIKKLNSQNLPIIEAAPELKVAAENLLPSRFVLSYGPSNAQAPVRKELEPQPPHSQNTSQVELSLAQNAWLQPFLNSQQENQKVILETPWYWYPYHAAGINTWQWLERNGYIPKQQLETILTHMTAPCPELDPSPRIRKTFDLLSTGVFFTLPIAKLKVLLSGWEPVIEAGIWQKKLAGLSPWAQLEFLENFDGLTNSHTTLKFQRIDRTL